MKKILLNFIILFVTLKVNSQVGYHKMLTDSNKWYVSGYIFGVKPGGSQNTNEIGGPCLGYYAANKDTLHNGKIYKNFFLEQMTFACPYMGSSIFDHALIREDTIQKKIYMIHPDSVNECIAMDFSMNVGDSLYLPFAGSSMILKNGYYKLDSIKTKSEIMGPRDHFYLSKYDAPINWHTNKRYYIEWIESIGATHFPINVIAEGENNDYNMPSYCTKNQFTSYVTCKFSNHVKWYQDSCALNYAQSHAGSGYMFSGDNCEFYGFSSNYKELSFLKKIELYPNPVIGKSFTLKFEAINFEPVDILIYNSAGQKIYNKKIEIGTSRNVLDMVDVVLTPGIYTLQIRSQKESTAIKFLKE